MRQPDRRQVLGGYIGRARDRPHRHIPRGLRSAAGEDKRLLQRGNRWKVRAESRTRRPRARDHGQCQIGTLRTDIPSRQLRFRAERRGKQLGQGALHGGSGTRRLSSRCSPQGGRKLRLSAGIPTDPLARGRHRVRDGHPPHLQDPRGVPRQDNDDIQRRTLSKSV